MLRSDKSNRQSVVNIPEEYFLMCSEAKSGTLSKYQDVGWRKNKVLQVAFLTGLICSLPRHIQYSTKMKKFTKLDISIKIIVEKN